MTIEQETFDNYLFLQDRLLGYGFQRDGNKLVYRKPLPKEDFQIILEYDGSPDFWRRKDIILLST